MTAIDAINEQHSLIESTDSLNGGSLDTSGENLKRAVLNEYANIKNQVDDMFGERAELSSVMHEAKLRGLECVRVSEGVVAVANCVEETLITFTPLSSTPDPG